MLRVWRLTAIAVMGAVVAGVTLPALTTSAEGGLGGQGGVSCAASNDWKGTQVNVQTFAVQGTVSQAPCPPPQVNGSAGSTTHAESSSPANPPPDGTACIRDVQASVSIGGLQKGAWQVQYYDPNDSKVVSATIGDGPGWPDWPLTGQQFTQTSWALGYSAAEMGSRQSPYIFWRMHGQYQSGQCVPDANGWTDAEGTRQCDPPGYGTPTGKGFPNECLVFGGVLGNLPYVAPNFATLTGYVPGLLDNLRSKFQTGQATTSWLYGGQSVIGAGVGQSIVRYPVCFADAGPPSNLGSTYTEEVLIPQPNPGPALVVDYVITAAVDQTVWDFGDGQTQTLSGSAALSQGCAGAEHTYYHVSADEYGSHTNHWLPPGVTAWPFGDEPHPDMLAVDAWHHLGVTVTALAREPNGDVLNQPVAVPASFQNIWLGDAPEWQTVGQFESIPCQCSPAPG